MGRRRRAMLAIGALAAVVSHCAALDFDSETPVVDMDAASFVSSILRTDNSIEGSEEGSEEETPTRTRRSGVSHAVSMTKRPTYWHSETGDESANSGASTVAPTPVTRTPVTIIIGTDAPTTETLAPVTVPVATESLAQETQVPVDTTSQSSSLADEESGVVDGSISTDAVVVVPDESTVVPFATTGAPTEDVTDASDWTGSSASSSNETVTASESGSGNSDGVSPGEVHASSSTEVSLDGSDQDTEDAASASHGDKKKNEKKETVYSSSGDSSTGSSPTTRGGSSKISRSSSHSSSSGDGSSGMGAFLNPGGVSDVNTSSASYYSLGTGSIVAIAGVIAGIMGVLVLFATISRKKYTDDEDESPLPYGYGMDIRSVARLSPTFMQDDSFMESGYNGSDLMVVMPAPHQYDGASSTSGESADEVSSLRGNMMAINHCNSLADASIRSRVPSGQSFSGDFEPGNVRMSALYSGGSSMTSGSAISGSWSSVLASDTERQTSRNTRDTSLSAWSIANLSSFGSTASGASGASGQHRMTRSSSAQSGDIRQTGGSDRSQGSTALSSSRLMNQPRTNRAAATAAAVASNRSNKSTEV